MSNRTGARYERELVTALDAAGYGVLRIPSSGSASSRDLPDVLAGQPAIGPDGERQSAVMAIELKSGRDTTLYVEKPEVDALKRFCERFGAVPRLGLRHTRQATSRNHFLVHPEDARRTPEGNYGLPIADIGERASEVIEP